jgi:hypothetical protein
VLLLLLLLLLVSAQTPQDQLGMTAQVQGGQLQLQCLLQAVV